MSSDVELLEAWRGGSTAAAETLIERHFAPLCRFFRNKVSHGVDDLVQQTLLACVERHDQFPEQWSFRTFLFVVARDQLYMHYRSRRRRGVFDPLEHSVADVDPSPSTVQAKIAEHRLILQGLRRLPLQLQMLLELHYWEGLTGPQLARVLDVPEGTVRSRLRRARELLAAKVDELDHGTGKLASEADFGRWLNELQTCVDATG